MGDSFAITRSRDSISSAGICSASTWSARSDNSVICNRATVNGSGGSSSSISSAWASGGASRVRGCEGAQPCAVGPVPRAASGADVRECAGAPVCVGSSEPCAVRPVPCADVSGLAPWAVCDGPCLEALPSSVRQASASTPRPPRAIRYRARPLRSPAARIEASHRRHIRVDGIEHAIRQIRRRGRGRDAPQRLVQLPIVDDPPIRIHGHSYPRAASPRLIRCRASITRHFNVPVFAPRIAAISSNVQSPLMASSSGSRSFGGSRSTSS